MITRNASAPMDIARGGQLETDLTALWLLVTAFLVFFMQVRICQWHSSIPSPSPCRHSGVFTGAACGRPRCLAEGSWQHWPCRSFGRHANTACMPTAKQSW